MTKLNELDITQLTAYLNALRSICLDIENNVRMDMGNVDRGFKTNELKKLTNLKNIYKNIEEEITRKANEIEF